MKDGNNKGYHYSGGIGNISSRLTIEGPIVKDKASFIISGRRTYADVVGKLAGIEALKGNKLYFYDFNGKINYIINENNRVFVSGYFGRDVMKLDTLMSIDYGNQTSTVRWNHLFNPRIFSNFTLIYSDFSYSLGQPSGPAAFNWNAHVIDYGFNNDYTWFLNPSNKIEFGIQEKLHFFKPGKIVQ